MKFTPLLAGIAAVLCLSASQNTQAGILNIEKGLSFRPDRSFTDNSIMEERFHNPMGLNGDVVRLFGDSQVTPTPAESSPRIRVGGTFEANAGDVFMITYDFAINLVTTEPITLTLGARTRSDGITNTFAGTIVLTPGVSHYQGTITGQTFQLATSGVWKGRLFFNFLSPSSGSTTSGPYADKLIIQIRAVDFQLVSVPEPSSIVFLGFGVVALGGFAVRRRRLA